MYLLVIVDGLGHGEAAAEAASIAIETATANPSEPLDNLLVLCHQALIGTRGAAVTLARVDAPNKLISWSGVGNVEAFLVRSTPRGVLPVSSPVLSGGIVGYSLPRVSIRSVELRRGDLVVCATDGVGRNFVEDVRLGRHVRQLADEILETCATGTDDALVLVARFRGTDEG